MGRLVAILDLAGPGAPPPRAALVFGKIRFSRVRRHCSAQRASVVGIFTGESSGNYSLDAFLFLPNGAECEVHGTLTPPGVHPIDIQPGAQVIATYACPAVGRCNRTGDLTLVFRRNLR